MAPATTKKRKNTKRITDTTEDNMTSLVWTKHQKEELLLAIKNHGINDLSALTVRNRSKDEIKAYIDKLIETVKSVNEVPLDGRNLKGSAFLRTYEFTDGTTPPLDQWLDILKRITFDDGKREHIFDTVSFVLKLKAISSHGPETSVHEHGNIDFSALYFYLSQACAGIIPVTLSAATNDFLVSVENEFSLKNAERKYDFLKKVNVSNLLKNKTKNAGVANSKINILKNTYINPLNVPQQLLK